MYETVFERLIHIDSLHRRLATELPSVFVGLSTGGGKVRVHYLSTPSVLQVALVEDIVTQHNALPLAADKTQITADGVDSATITCDAVVLANDTTVAYNVWLNDSVYTADGVADVESGAVSLVLTTETAGVYTIEVARTGGGKYQSGIIQIKAV